MHGMESRTDFVRDESHKVSKINIGVEYLNLNSSTVFFCDISEIASVVGTEWEMYIGMLNSQEKDRVLKFRFDDDRRRALVSTLLQRWIVRKQLNVDRNECFEIKRTIENKPYAVLKSSSIPAEETSLGFWNYNLSHHGIYVGICCDTSKLVGVDIVDLNTRTTMASTAYAYAKIFKAQLHPEELEGILNQSSECDAYKLFFIIWSLKESFIKAVGLGLGYDLQRLRFRVHYCADTLSDNNGAGSSTFSNYTEDNLRGYATVTLDGEERSVHRSVGLYVSAEASAASADSLTHHSPALNSPPISPEREWKFDFFGLDYRHVVSIAQGPLCESTTSYKKSAFPSMPPLYTEAGTTSDGGNRDRDITVEKVSIPKGVKLSINSLLTPYEQMQIPAPQPLSPPLTELNNRHDPSVLVKNEREIYTGIDSSYSGSDADHNSSNAVSVNFPLSPYAATVCNGRKSPIDLEQEVPSEGLQSDKPKTDDRSCDSQNPSPLPSMIETSTSVATAHVLTNKLATTLVIESTSLEKESLPESKILPNSSNSGRHNLESDKTGSSFGDSTSQRPFVKLQQQRESENLGDDVSDGALDWRIMSLPHRLRKNSLDLSSPSEDHFDLSDTDDAPPMNNDCIPVRESQIHTRAVDISALNVEIDQDRFLGDFNSPASWRTQTTGTFLFPPTASLTPSTEDDSECKGIKDDLDVGIPVDVNKDGHRERSVFSNLFGCACM